MEDEPGFLDRANEIITRRGANAAQKVDGVQEEGETPGGPVRKGAEAAAEVASAVPELAMAALPEPVRNALSALGSFFGKQVQEKVVDPLSRTPVIEKLAEKPEGALEEVLGTTAAVGEVASDVLSVAAPAKAADALAAKGKNAIVGAVDDIKGALPKPGTAPSAPGALADVITPIDAPTMSVLNPTKLIPKDKLKNVPIESIRAAAVDKTAKLDDYVKVAKTAAVDYSKPTPLVKAGERGSEALNVIKNKMTKQAQLKNEALGAVGDKTVKNVAAVRAEMRDLFRERVGVNLVKKDGKLVIENAPGRQSKVAFDPADNKMMADAYRTLAKLGKSPTVRQVDDTVDALQDILYKRKTLTAVPVNGQVEAVLKQMTGKLNNAVKKIGGEQYTKANAKYAYYVDTFDKLNKALGQEGVRGGTLMKALFSPSGEAPRRLFADIKKLTGIDLVEEATLAKFAMESIGDARQASLLEEVIRTGSITPMGFVGKAVDKLLDKAKDPIGKAKRIINEEPKP